MLSLGNLLTDEQLTPFVAKGLKAKPSRFTPMDSRLDGKEYLQRWKEGGGVN